MNAIWGRDERERTADDRADHWAYLVLSFGILAVVAYRALVSQVASWDMLGLVIGAGFVGTAHRIRARAASRSWASSAALALLVAGAVAAAVGLLARG